MLDTCIYTELFPLPFSLCTGTEVLLLQVSQHFCSPWTRFEELPTTLCLHRQTVLTCSLNINNKGKQGLGSLVPLQASFAALIKHAKQNPIQLEETILSMTHNAFHDTQRSMRNALVGKLQSDCIMWTTDDITFIMVSTDWQTYSCSFAVIQNKHVKYRILHCLRTTHFQFNFGRRPWNKVGLRLNCGLPSLLFSHSRLCTWLGQEACRECCRSARDTG